MNLAALPAAAKPCRSCGAPILWVRTASTGKAMPLDAVPVSPFAGNVILVNGKAVVLGKTDVRTPEQTYYVSHFATCPNAAQHRKAE